MLMGGLLDLVQRRGAWAPPPPLSFLLAVPNLTGHQLTAMCTKYQSLCCCIMVRCCAVLMCLLKG